ncbi:MAG: hypothetical protein AB1489_28805 [Acidobacteriota bacterium]
MSEDKIAGFLANYRAQQGDLNQKYSHYLSNLQKSNNPKWKTIARTIELLEKSSDPVANQVAKRIKENRFVVVMDELGSNRGCLREPGVFDKTDELTDGVIVLDSRYVDNVIGAAGVLAHEIRHVLDLEETKAGRLNIGIRIGDPSSLNASEPQNRADTYAGHVLSVLGYRKAIKYGLSQEGKAEKKKIWGARWMLDSEELIDPKMSRLQEFGARKEKKAVFCHRRCKSKPGECARKVYFPPCWDH